MRKWVARVCLLVGVGIVVERVVPNALRARSHRTAAAPVGVAATEPGASALGTTRSTSRTPQEIYHFADALDAPGHTAQDDVQLLASVIHLYRTVLKGSNPVGDNAEITAALTGRNKFGYAFIRPDSPAINAKGELCDRWGTPFFFHQISGTMMQIRSAGPDKEHWTADDLVAN
jgi:hypothetical protein